MGSPGGAVASRLFLDELCVVGQRDDRSGLLPAALTTGTSAGGAIVVVTGVRGSAAELAPLLSRYSSVTVLGLGEAQGIAPILGAQVILASGRAADSPKVLARDSSEPSIAIDSSGRLHVVWVSASAAGDQSTMNLVQYTRTTVAYPIQADLEDPARERP